MLNAYDLHKLKLEGLNNLNRFITSKEIKAIRPCHKANFKLVGFIAVFYQTLKKGLTPALHYSTDYNGKKYYQNSIKY